MRSRCTLHKDKLPEFREWLNGLGWKIADLKHPFEVLRAYHPDYKGVLIVYLKMRARHHCTTHGLSQQLLMKWLRERASK